MSTGPIFNVGDLATPATRLIEKISEGVEGFFKPYQIKRIATAEAEAQLAKESPGVEMTELRRRAMRRFVNEEAKRQENMESITDKAIPYLEDKSRPEEIDSDWIANFFEKCRITSDREMQQLWSKILAGEANAPGKFTKRTVNLLSSLDKSDAILFSKLCGFMWSGLGQDPFIYDIDQAIYSSEVNFGSIMHLQMIGLVSYQNTGFSKICPEKVVTLEYFGDHYLLNLKDGAERFNVGEVIFTQVGIDLAQVCEPKAVPGLVEYLIKRWMEQGYVVACPLPAAPSVSPPRD